MTKGGAAAGLVFIPSPGVGHLVSTIEFANLLINQDHRLSITVLVTPNDSQSQSQLPSQSQRLRLINLPQPPSHTTTMVDILEQQKPHVKHAVSELTLSGPPLAAFVVDMFCTTMIDVAKHFHLPSLVFFTSSFSCLASMLHLHSLIEHNNTDFRTSPSSLIPCFANPLPSTALPFMVLDKERAPFFSAYCRGLLKADAIILNSFHHLEPYAFSHALSHIPIPVYPVGPILNLNQPDDKTHHHDNTIFDWLDLQPPSSVVFLCFGSMGSFGEDQVREIARALENSGARFLWSLRKPPPTGSSFFTPPSDYAPSDLLRILPAGFLDRTARIGKLIAWAPQAQVLAHPATGAFVSHCGWNSTLESVYFGVPIATWPLYAEQQMNAFSLLRELNLAVEIAMDYKVDFKTGRNTLLSADRIEKGIKSVMNMDEETRYRVKEMSEKSRKTLLEGGSSYSYIQRLIDYIMIQVSSKQTYGQLD